MHRQWILKEREKKPRLISKNEATNLIADYYRQNPTEPFLAAQEAIARLELWEKGSHIANNGCVVSCVRGPNPEDSKAVSEFMRECQEIDAKLNKETQRIYDETKAKLDQLCKPTIGERVTVCIVGVGCGLAICGVLITALAMVVATAMLPVFIGSLIYRLLN